MSTQWTWIVQTIYLFVKIEALAFRKTTPTTSSINKKCFFPSSCLSPLAQRNLLIFTELNGSQITVVPINSLLLHRFELVGGCSSNTSGCCSHVPSISLFVFTSFSTLAVFSFSKQTSRQRTLNETLICWSRCCRCCVCGQNCTTASRVAGY